MISLLQSLRNIPFAIVDVETTGASADFGHRVMEIGIARVEGGQIVARYESLCDPQRKIGPGVTALTGISDEMVFGQPSFASQLLSILPLLKDAVIVGHNVRFDLSFIQKEFRRTGLEMTRELGSAHVVDTVRIARKQFGRGGNGLQKLSRRLGYEPGVAHRALADVITTYEVLDRMITMLGGWGINLCDLIMKQGGPMSLLPASPRESLLPLELEEALEQRCAVLMEYVDANRKRTTRVIEPIEVRRGGGELMLIAHCQMRNDRRTFKVERIVQLTRLVEGPCL